MTEAVIKDPARKESVRTASTLHHVLEQRLPQVLQELIKQYPVLSFASSLSLEDMVLTDVIARHQLPIDIFTLDTQRLHKETYTLLGQVQARYSSLKIRVIAPDAQAIDSLLVRIGVDGFYKSNDARKDCCGVRKIEPLKRALANSQAWITGLRREQSEARSALSFKSLDPLTGLDKYNPLMEWSQEAVEGYLERHQVPINALHAQGFPSIGCAPCTRAIKPGEHPRAGRWWWESEKANTHGEASQECGLHVDESGQLVRSASADTAANLGDQHISK
jgi:phosphoadenosine phosphosulfate reductase